MPNIDGALCLELTDSTFPIYGLVRGNIEQKGRSTPGRQKQEPWPRPEPNAQLTPRRAATRQYVPSRSPGFVRIR
ncbi:hypothetical protein NDU88_005843 [Pleurodeles waltl]|uniref:Uncharacterized protein n=1 Tax=Pleurodeles waltl TaxID=8319 RepID=A0AAV7UN88_PLEWA|nr:hypothetical protein NDU88_005843 [Pleurodeles waltl]